MSEDERLALYKHRAAKHADDFGYALLLLKWIRPSDPAARLPEYLAAMQCSLLR